MKTASQVQSDRTGYVAKPQNLSPAAPAEDNHVPHGEPIEIGLWGSTLIEFGSVIMFIADVLWTNRARLIRDVYQKIESPYERYVFGRGLAFAKALNERFVEGDGCRDAKPNDDFGIPPALLGFEGPVKYTFSDCHFALTQALILQNNLVEKASKAISEGGDPYEGAKIAMALFVAHRAACGDCVGLDSLSESALSFPDDVIEILAIEQIAVWFDSWTGLELDHLKEGRPATYWRGIHHTASRQQPVRRTAATRPLRNSKR